MRNIYFGSMVVLACACGPVLDPVETASDTAPEPTTTDRFPPIGETMDPISTSTGFNSTSTGFDPSTTETTGAYGPEGTGGGGAGYGEAVIPPKCKPVVDQLGTVIGQACCLKPYVDATGVKQCGCWAEPLTGLCLELCPAVCPQDQICKVVSVGGQAFEPVCWPLG